MDKTLKNNLVAALVGTEKEKHNCYAENIECAWACIKGKHREVLGKRYGAEQKSIKEIAGETISEIDKSKTISASRAWQIERIALRKLRNRIERACGDSNGDDFLRYIHDVFPSRIANSIINHDIKSKDEILDLIKTNPKKMMKWKNFGKKSFSQLCEILKIKEPDLCEGKARCPCCGQVIIKKVREQNK